MLTSAETAATIESIAAVQLPNGMIPWFHGGHADEQYVPIVTASRS